MGAITMQLKSNLLIHSIVPFVRSDLRALSESVAVTANILFVEGLPLDELKITKHVFPAVAKTLDKKVSAVCRAAERLANEVWEHMDDDMQKTIIGRVVPDIRSTSDLIVYLAYYVYWDKPYFEVIKEQYAALMK